MSELVHGDIRHLERPLTPDVLYPQVHGDIRHLEINTMMPLWMFYVHGDIRHLETQLHKAQILE